MGLQTKTILSVIYDMSVINMLIGIKRAKKFYPFYFVDISIGKFNISPTEKSYVISLVFLFIGVFIYLSVYPSINITYHRKNIICNFIGELAIAKIFTIILFKFFLKYIYIFFLVDIFLFFTEKTFF